MTAIVKHEGSAVMVSEDKPRLTFSQMVQMGDALVKTGFLPDHIKTGAQAAAIMMTGEELGMLPMRALRSLQMVKGKVVESADSQLARFKSDGGKAKFLHLDETKAVLWLKHRNGDEHTETWTTGDAKAAGLGDMHRKYPKAMNRSRAITAGLKSVGWEGSIGNYDPEEAATFSAGREDAKSAVVPTVSTSTQVRTGTVGTATTRTTRTTANTASGDSDLSSDVADGEPLMDMSDGSETGPTPGQSGEIKSLLSELGVTQARGTYLEGIVPGARTVDDYDRVIDGLRLRLTARTKQPEAGTSQDQRDAIDELQTALTLTTTGVYALAGLEGRQPGPMTYAEAEAVIAALTAHRAKLDAKKGGGA